MDFTCVEIKNVKYIKLISLDKQSEKDLDLTTIHKDQELAYLNIFLIDKNKKKTLLKSIQINNIRPGNTGIPELHLSVAYDGKQYYKIVLKLNGYIYHNSVIDMKLVKKSPFRIGNIALISSAIVILFFLGFFMIKTLGNSRNIQMVNNSTIGNTENQDGNNRESGKEQKTTDQTTTDQTTTDQTTTDQTTTDQTTTDQTTTDQTTTDQTATDQTTTEHTETIIESRLIDDNATVYFYPNSIILTSEAKAILRQVLQILRSEDNLYVDIIGHCAFFGTENGRQEISTERAESVYSFFIDNGWTPQEQPKLAGLGHDQIVTRDPEKQNLNRRVEITIKSNEE